MPALTLLTRSNTYGRVDDYPLDDGGLAGAAAQSFSAQRRTHVLRGAVAIAAFAFVAGTGPTAAPLRTESMRAGRLQSSSFCVSGRPWLARAPPSHSCTQTSHPTGQRFARAKPCGTGRSTRRFACALRTPGPRGDDVSLTSGCPTDSRPR